MEGFNYEFGGLYLEELILGILVNIPFICNMPTALIEMGFKCYLPYLVSVRAIFAFL